MVHEIRPRAFPTQSFLCDCRAWKQVNLLEPARLVFRSSNLTEGLHERLVPEPPGVRLASCLPVALLRDFVRLVRPHHEEGPKLLGKPHDSMRMRGPWHTYKLAHCKCCRWCLDLHVLAIYTYVKYVYIYIYIYMQIHIHIHVHVHMHIHIHIYIYIYIYMCIYVYICISS